MYLVTFCNETAKDGSYKTAATNWLAKAKTLLKEPKDLAEMHYETAKMFQKTGDKSTAQKEASEAHKAATLAKIDLKKFNELNEKMK